MYNALCYHETKKCIIAYYLQHWSFNVTFSVVSRDPESICMHISTVSPSVADIDWLEKDSTTTKKDDTCGILNI